MRPSLHTNTSHNLAEFRSSLFQFWVSRGSSSLWCTGTAWSHQMPSTSSTTYSTHLNPLSCALHSLGQRRFSECIYLFASVNQTLWMRPRRPLQEINSKIGNFYRFSSPTSNWQSQYQSFSLDGRIAWTQT